MTGYHVPLGVQLNVEDSAGDFGEIAYRWLDEACTALCPEGRAALAGLPARVSRSAQPYGPLGEPGDIFGIVQVNPRAKRYGTERNCSTEGMRWLRRELAKAPRSAGMWIGRLDERGHRSGRLLSVGTANEDESPTWLRLEGHVDEDLFLDPESGPALQRRWLDALFTFADQLNPGFGHVTYGYYGGKTSLEHSFIRQEYSRERCDPKLSVNANRRCLRGYSWLTIVPQELVPRVGGIDGLRDCGAFVDVRPLARGGVWLLATEDYRDFDDEALRAVFCTLAPILRSGMPSVLPSRGEPPQKVVFEDAAEAASSS